jgi:hypothetical protein
MGAEIFRSSQTCTKLSLAPVAKKWVLVSGDHAIPEIWVEHLIVLLLKVFQNSLKVTVIKDSFFLSLQNDEFYTPTTQCMYSDVSIKNIDILPNRQYIANTADSAQEQYS